MAINPPLGRKLRMGLIGGAGGFIGRVHVTAATLDGRAELIAGALSSEPEKARAAAADFGIAPARAYGSYAEMVERESRLPTNDRIDFVSIATPNHTHFVIARAFADAGFPIVCDKPMTLDLTQAEELYRILQRTHVPFVLTHNYTGYPLVRQARDMIQSGELGEINAVRTAYLQGSLRRRRTPEQQKRVAWKTDPNRAGPSGCFGDIGIHGYNLTRFITRLVPDEVSCTLRTFEPIGPLDDYGSAVLRFENGALGTITASRISHGRENGLRIEIDGARGSLDWQQEEPNVLRVRANGQPLRFYSRDSHADFLSVVARASCRLPGGHPEGYFEAFANIYTAAFDDFCARSSGVRSNVGDTLYPNASDGLDGMYFVNQCVASSQQDASWLSLRHPLLSEAAREPPQV
jgi:predicted dehydrogenase